MKPETLKYWQERYHNADSKYSTISNKVIRRNARYDGTSNQYSRQDTVSTKKADTINNIVFEMIETQINNVVPAPKITARNPEDSGLAIMLEDFLKAEMDRLDSEKLNDRAERETYKQGTVVYQVDWDNTKTTPISEGELIVKLYPISRVKFQPDGVQDIAEMEYLFTEDDVSRRKLGMMYNKDWKEITSKPDQEDLCELITLHYFNDDNQLSRLGWIKNTEEIIFDEENYMYRKFRTCSKCDTRNHLDDVCPICENKKFTYKISDEEILSEDIILLPDETNPEQKEILARKGDTIPYYKVNRLPFVVRNISQEGSIYGVSDADVLENVQADLNMLTKKIRENILKGGSIITKNKNTKIKMNDEPLKVLDVNSASEADQIQVKNLQASTQQEMISISNWYAFGRNSLGITDSYQGKRDPTAESGKAKEVAPSQANGRLESKRRMKDDAYQQLYALMAEFLWAFCDEPRTYTKQLPDGSIEKGIFSRYEFLAKNEKTGKIYYNTRFLFSVDNASLLSTNRELMWRETVNNYTRGTFGNPADPRSLQLFWNIMHKLGYPSSEEALSSIKARANLLPVEVQQAIMNNPQILEAVKQVMQEGGENSNVQNSKQ